MYISLVLFKENIDIFNLGHAVYTFKHQHFKSYKKDIHGCFAISTLQMACLV